MNGRRVGTFTFGITLIGVGVVYLLYAFLPDSLNLVFILQFWPVVLITLGSEVLLSYFLNREDKLRYDGAAIFLSICVVGLAWCIAAFQMALEYSEAHNGYWCL